MYWYEMNNDPNKLEIMSLYEPVKCWLSTITDLHELNWFQSIRLSFILVWPWFMCWPVPSPPTNVNVTVDTPITVKVFWSPPVNPNGPAEQLRYMVKYSTQINNLHQVFNKTVKVVADSDRMYHYNLTNLQPGHTYQIKVCTMWQVKTKTHLPD